MNTENIKGHTDVKKGENACNGWEGSGDSIEVNAI